MVLAGAVELDVADQDQLVVVGVEHRRQHVLGPLREPGELLGVGAGHPGRGFDEPVPVRVLPDGEQDLTHRTLDTPGVDQLAQRDSPPPSSPPSAGSSAVGLAYELPEPDPLPGEAMSFTSEAAVSASSFGVSTGGRSDGSRLP